MGTNGRLPLSQRPNWELQADKTYFAKSRKAILEEIKRRLRERGEAVSHAALMRLAPELQADMERLGLGSMKAFCTHLKQQRS